MEKERQDDLKGDEVVISGISGIFPKSDYLLEFMENLYNKVDMIINLDPYLVHPDAPQHVGVINTPNRLDAQFFKVTFNQAMTMDPMCRKLMEHSYSAIFDAGVNPISLNAKKIGVYVGVSYLDAIKECMMSDSKKNVFFISGSSKTMLANRISYYLNSKGPSYVIDASNASSLMSLEQAYLHLVSGEIEAAIVAGCNLCKQPTLSVNLKRTGLLCMDGKTKCFDKNGDGCARSEAVSVIFLQKAKDAKRIYSQVYHVKSSYSKPEVNSISLRKEHDIVTFLEDFYSEIDVEPSEVDFVEADAYGVADRDEEELKAISKFFGEKSPVHVGSVKSNMGNSEGASGICSLTKACLAYHKGEIAANIHCYNPMEVKNTVVLRDNMPFNRGFIAINDFSYTGVDSHALLKGYYKPKDLNRYNTQIPYLVTVSGRDEDCVNELFNILQSYPFDPEYIGLLHNIHNHEIKGHTARGFIVLDKDSDNKTKTLVRTVDYYSGNKRQIWFVFSGMGSQWVGMGVDLMRIPIFNEAIQKVDKILKTKGLDIIKILCDKDKTMFDNILHCFVGIAAVQIGLIDILRAVGIQCDYMIGHSAGETACGYADGCFTAEEMILSAYSRGRASAETKFIKGSMAAVGLGYNDLYPICPPEIDIACHNSSESTTISGPAEEVDKFLEQLTAKEIFCKKVPCSDIAFHSRFISAAGPTLSNYLDEVIKEPKPRSSKWLSTSIPEEKWDVPLAKHCSSEYFTNNLLNSVYFEEAMKHIPAESVVIEIAPHGLLQAILKRELKECLHIPLTRRGHGDQVQFLLGAIGKIYGAGFNVKIDTLYPQIEYPVSTGTQFLSHLVKWEHSEDWLVLARQEENVIYTPSRDLVVSLYDKEYAFIKDHIRDGDIIFPESALLVLTWQTLAMSMDVNFNELPVILSDIKFTNQIVLKQENLLKLSICITKQNGRFEVVYDNQTVVSGYINQYENNPKRECEHSNDVNSDVTLYTPDIYKLLNLRGHVYKNNFQSLHSLNIKCSEGYIKWTGDWINFLDALLQINIFANDYNGVSRPRLIESLIIDVVEHQKMENIIMDGTNCYKADYYNNFKVLRSGGVQMVNVNFENLVCQRLESDFLGSIQFWPHFPQNEIDLSAAIAINMQIIGDAVLKNNISMTELRTSNLSLFTNNIRKVTSELSLTLGFDSISIENDNMKALDEVTETDVLAVYDFVMNAEMIADIYNKLPENGFVLTLEKKKNKKYIIQTDYFNILSVFPITGDYILALMNKVNINHAIEERAVVRVEDDKFSMIEIEKEVKNNKRIVLLYEKDYFYDYKGYLENLRREYGNKIDIYAILDENAPDFNLNNNFYNKQLQNNLAINILYEGKWGGYYYTNFDNSNDFNQNYKLSLKEVGNVNSLYWEEVETIEQNNTVQVEYAGLSLKDVEKLEGGTVNEKKLSFGMDFSGLDTRGKRVMGIISGGAISKSIRANTDLLWPVPKHWSLEEAATVPLPYALAYYCLTVRGCMYPGASVFVSGGAGALGQAVISISLGFNCDVYTTVSDPAKKKFLLNLFPALDENKILDSSYDDFYASAIKQTNNELCTFVINCDSGANRRAAMKCVGRLGIFLDLSVKDMIDNQSFGMGFVGLKSYTGVDFSSVFKLENSEERKLLQSLVAEGIAKGIVRPLTYITFSPFEISRAFRFISSRRNRGRVLLDLSNQLTVDVMPRLMLSPQRSYVVIGDQDELTASLIDLLTEQGARKIFLQIKSKPITPFIEAKILLWTKQDVEVKISRYGIESEEQCKVLINKATHLAPIEGIFIVLYKLSALETAYTRVITSIANVDKLSRNLDSLRHFVILANNNKNKVEDEYMFSICTKICQYRNDIGLASVLCRGEYVDEFENVSVEHNKKPKQSLRQILNSMEKSIKKNYSHVTSFNTNKNTKIEYMKKLNEIIGKKINEKELNMNITLKDVVTDEFIVSKIRNLILETYQTCLSEEKLKQMSLLSIQNIDYNLDKMKNTIGLEMFYSFVDEDSFEACEPMKQMISLMYNYPEKVYEMENIDPAADYLILIPGFEGHYRIFESLCSSLKIKAMTLQLGPDVKGNTVSEIAENIMKNTIINLEEKKRFYLLGYSFGVNVALEIAALLEKKGVTGTVFCLDSSPDTVREQLNTYIGNLTASELQNKLIDHFYTLMTKETNIELNNVMETFDTFEDKIRAFVKAVKERISYPQEYIRLTLESAYNRIVLARNYKPNYKLGSQLVLLKGKPHTSNKSLLNDYNLGDYSKKPVKIMNIDSDHTFMPYNVNISATINGMLDEDLQIKYKNTNQCLSYMFAK